MFLSSQIASDLKHREMYIDGDIKFKDNTFGHFKINANTGTLIGRVRYRNLKRSSCRFAAQNGPVDGQEQLLSD